MHASARLLAPPITPAGTCEHALPLRKALVAARGSWHAAVRTLLTHFNADRLSTCGHRRRMCRAERDEEWRRRFRRGEITPRPARVSTQALRSARVRAGSGRSGVRGWRGQSSPLLPPLQVADSSFTHSNDVWVLDTRSLSWSRATLPHPAAAAQCITGRHLGGGGSEFGARRGHSAALHSRSGRVLVFGGTTGEERGRETFTNDLWALHTATAPAGDVGTPLFWEEIVTSGLPPAPRRGHAAVVSGECMVVVGGYANDALVHALHIGTLAGSNSAVDVAALGTRPQPWSWARVRSEGEAPEGLALFGAASQRGHLYLFGGHNFEPPGQRHEEQVP